MKCISVNGRMRYDGDIFSSAEQKYAIRIRDDIKEFIEKNAGGDPVKDIIVCKGEEYEVRTFLSADKTDEDYCIEEPMDYFLGRTKARIVPVAVDPGDNYYCVNNETGKVYYWSANLDEYFILAEELDSFSMLFT